MNRGRQLVAALLATVLTLTGAAGWVACAGERARQDRAAHRTPADLHTCCLGAAQVPEACDGKAAAMPAGHCAACACGARADDQLQAIPPAGQWSRADAGAPRDAVVAPPQGPGLSPVQLHFAREKPSPATLALLLKSATGLRSPPHCA